MRISDCSSDVFSSDLDAQFFYPDGPAAMRVADALGLPFSAKARGADISHFGHDPATRSQVFEAGAKGAGLPAVSEAIAGGLVGIALDPAWRRGGEGKSCVRDGKTGGGRGDKKKKDQK